MDYIVYEISFEDEGNVEDYYRLQIDIGEVVVYEDTIWIGEGEGDYYVDYPYDYYGYSSYEPIDPSIVVLPYFRMRFRYLLMWKMLMASLGQLQQV